MLIFSYCLTLVLSAFEIEVGTYKGMIVIGQARKFLECMNEQVSSACLTITLGVAVRLPGRKAVATTSHKRCGSVVLRLPWRSAGGCPQLLFQTLRSRFPDQRG